jgi:hypothetical protein
MARRTPQSFAKRQREQAKREKQAEKIAARRERQKVRAERAPGEDPDLAGIVPGPQPPRED